MRLLLKPGLLALPLILLSWFVYAWMIPFVMATWKITGDEPHYLLAAYSLSHDGDLDLRNNYLNHDYKGFYAADYLDPHVKQQTNGSWLLVHDLGLPVLITPAFAFGGRPGVMQFFAFLGALLAGQMFLLGWEVSGRWWAGALGWLAFSFSAPWALYIFQIYPELIGGLFILFATRHILGTPSWLDLEPPSRGWFRLGWGLVALALASLPWLSGRYMPLLVLLVGLLARRQRTNKKLWLTVGGLALISLAIYLLVNFVFYGGPTPSNTAAGNAVGAGFSNVGADQIWRGLSGWWLDQQRGLLVYGPVLLLAIIGLPHLWSLRRWDGFLVLAPFALIWLLASLWGGFYIGWEISARFLIVGLPLLVAALAAAFARIRSVLFWPLAAGLVTLSIFNTALIVLNPFYAFHESPVKFYEEATGWQIRPFLPALGTRSLITPTDGASFWSMPEGQAGYLSQSTLTDLAIGWYVLRGQAQLTQSASARAPALLFDIYSSESGIELSHTDIPVEANKPLINLNIAFYNPYLNHWDYPLYVDLQSTGAAGVRLSYLSVDPDPLPTYGRVLIWIILISALVLLFADKKTVRSALARLALRNSRIKSSEP